MKPLASLGGDDAVASSDAVADAAVIVSTETVRELTAEQDEGRAEAPYRRPERRVAAETWQLLDYLAAHYPNGAWIVRG